MSSPQDADEIQNLFDNNRRWATQVERDDPGFFKRLAQQQSDLAALDPVSAQARLCELNVMHQVKSLCQTTVIKQAWERGQPVDVHGWIYGVEDGLLRDLGLRITSLADLEQLESGKRV